MTKKGERYPRKRIRAELAHEDAVESDHAGDGEEIEHIRRESHSKVAGLGPSSRSLVRDAMVGLGGLDPADGDASVIVWALTSAPPA